MSKKNLAELEEQLARMKARQAALKEQLAAERKAADIRARKELARKKYELADLIIEYVGGEDVLEKKESVKKYLERYGHSLTQFLKNPEYMQDN